MLKRFIPAAMLMAAATPALAHTGHHAFSGFSAGFAHPLGGFDHVLAMVSVGLFASMLGGRSLWALPASFMGMMLIGGALGLMGVQLPGAEIGIAASVVALGAVVMLGRQWPIAAAMALVGGFAVFHGYAHGAEMSAGANAVLYSLGFIGATMMLHAAGIVAGLKVLSRGYAVRFAGAAVTAAGLLIVLS
jgi:urease accessory protein